MKKTYELNIFDQQLERLKLVTGRRTQVELAELLGVRQCSVSNARRRGKIPAEWLLRLVIAKGVNPEWVLSGSGPCFVQAEAVDSLSCAKLNTSAESANGASEAGPRPADAPRSSGGSGI